MDILEELVDTWKHRSEKSYDRGNKATNPYTQERLYAEGATYSLCAYELDRMLVDLSLNGVELPDAPESGGDDTIP